MTGEGPQKTRTVSPRAGYGGDVMFAHVEGGRLVRVEGDGESRIGRGELTRFASRYVERVYSEDRLLRPLKRVGERGSGEFEPIDWPEAIETVAEALTRIATENDPRALLHFSANGNQGAMEQFARLFLSYYGGYSTLYGDLCNSAGIEATRLTFGALHHHPPEDYLNSRMIVVWGKNPALTNPHQVPFLQRARENGAHLVCIDPIRTATAELCDEHIAPRPGTDGFLANAIAHVLIEERLVDEKFVSRHVHGFQDYKWMVRNYEPAKAEKTCGLEADAIVDFARRFEAAKPANINVGFGVQRRRNGGQTVRAIAAMQSITGNIGVSGGGFDYFNQAAFVTRPYPFRLPAPPRVRQLGSVSRMGRGILRAKAPPIRAAIIERANPMTQVPFTSAIHYALTRLDFVCVIDQFLTDTARRADIVLPAKSMFESLDVHPDPWHGILHLRPPCIDPPGEVKTEQEIYRLLAERLGYPLEQFELDAEEVLNAILPPGLSVNRLRKQPFDRRGPDFIPFADGRYPTPSGRIELRSESAEVSWRVDPLPFYTPPRESEEGDPERFRRFPLQLLTPKCAGSHNSQWALDNGIARDQREDAIRIHPEDAEKRGISQGERIRLFNDRGQVRLEAYLDDALRPGVVALANGRWISLHGACANMLTHDDVSDMGYGAIVFDCLVEAEKIEE